MSNRGEMWVHGNSVNVQYPGGEGASLFTPGHRMLNVTDPDHSGALIPWSDMLGFRTAKGATFRGAFGTPSAHTSNWFHFSIPTPAFFPQPGVGHLAITVDKVSVYYETPADETITIRNIAVTGGGTTQGVRGLDSRRLFGTHNVQEQEGVNAWMLLTPITMGLGRNNSVLISVEVIFDANGDITFTAAGIHYSVP
jgi:hypothetical protein